MQKAWEDETPAAQFMRRLVRQRAVEFMRSPEYLKRLRFDYEQAMRDQKLFGHVWEEYGTDVFELIAEAHGEIWGAGTGEKKDTAVNQRRSIEHDDVATTREESPRERKHQLQRKPEASLGVVEKERCKAEAETREKVGCRREDFYRRAGGSC